MDQKPSHSWPTKGMAVSLLFICLTSEVLSEGIIAVAELKTLTPFHGLPHRLLYGLPLYFYSKKYIHIYIFLCVCVYNGIYTIMYNYACMKFIECKVLNCPMSVAIFCHTIQICIIKPMNIFWGLSCTQWISFSLL